MGNAAGPIDELYSWLLAHGGVIDGVHVSQLDDHGRGLFASRPLKKGDVVVRIPNDMVLTGDTARQAKHISMAIEAAQDAGLFNEVAELAQSDPDAVAVVLFLLAASVDTNSPWLPWLRSLPQHIHTPVTVSEEILDRYLEGSLVYSMAYSLRLELREIYDKLIQDFLTKKFPNVFPSDRVTWDLFLWAHSVVESRAFGQSNRHSSDKDENENPNRTLLVPYIDMTNHACQPSAIVAEFDTWTESNVQKGYQLTVKATEVKQGDEIMISYGLLDNARLLLHYGFAQCRNPHDRIQLSLMEPEDDAFGLLTKKMVLMAVNPGGLLGFQHDISLEDPLPVSLLASSRVLCASEDHEEMLKAQTDFSKPLSNANERNVLLDFRRLAANMLGGYAQGGRNLGTDITSDGEEDGDNDAGMRGFLVSCRTYTDESRNILQQTSYEIEHRLCALEGGSKEDKPSGVCDESATIRNSS